MLLLYYTVTKCIMINISLGLTNTVLYIPYINHALTNLVGQHMSV